MHNKPLVTFTKTYDTAIKDDYKVFVNNPLKGQADNVTVVPTPDGFIFAIEHETETFVFGLSGETLDSMLAAIKDLNDNAFKTQN